MDSKVTMRGSSSDSWRRTRVRGRFESKRVEAEDELAGIMLSALLICSDYEVDLSEAFARKMESSELNYPLTRCGRS